MYEPAELVELQKMSYVFFLDFLFKLTYHCNNSKILNRRCTLISLDPREKISLTHLKITIALLKFFRILKILTAVLMLISYIVSLAVLWVPDRVLKKMRRRGFIVYGHKGFPEPRIKGAFEFMNNRKGF